MSCDPLRRSGKAPLGVCVSSFGRFHAFDLAKQLEKREVLGRLYTAYPKYRVDEVSRSRIDASPWIGVPTIAARRMSGGLPLNWLNRQAIEAFDRWVAVRLEPCRVFHFMSSFGLRSLLVAKKRFGALTVCDRGSTHILAQEDLLMDEHKRWGLKYRGIDRHVIERELEEYEISDLVAVPSSFAYRSFTERGVSPARLIKVPYGTDLDVFRPQPKQSDVFRVIFVGQISLRKGIPYLLEAVCGEPMPRLELWLIGQVFPDVKQFLAQYRGRYRHLGVVPRRKLGDFYSQGTVLVVPSIEEGLALVQAQAMACGLPVVATRNAGAEDLFTDGVEGFIVPPRDPEAIRERILRLYSNRSECAEMGRAAIRRVARLGGWDRYGEEMVSAYAAALESGRGDANTTSRHNPVST